ncbi:hypothetical protein PG987_006524 [Apiospora arundinis]
MPSSSDFDGNTHMVKAGPSWVPLLEQPAFTPTRKMRVVCVGAGFAGLILAHKVQHELKLEDEIDLVIYDRNPDVGGTWFENTYPGAGCDIPVHAYVFPFEGNPDWSSFYAGQAEILAYMKRTAEKYDLCKHIQFNSEVERAIWDEDTAKWQITIRQGDTSKREDADFFINSSGFLNKWKMPNIQGLDRFKGKVLHTAKWDPEYQWEGKKVAVLGNGASGIQVVTAMQPKVEKLVNYVRQRTWISINFLGDKTPEGVNFTYTEEQKAIWREDPKALMAYRKELEQGLNAFFFAMCLDNPIQPVFESLCKERMRASLKDAPELQEQIMPDFPAGCRRISPGDGYLEALQQPNCRACWDPIECVTETGIRLTNGDEEAFDLIVCATGFDSSWLPQWEMVGRDGARLEDMWCEDPRAFFTTQVENFPNYGMVNGPNPPISHGSVLAQMSWTVDYLLRWVTRMSRHDMRTLCVKREAVDDYNEYAQEFLKRTVWSKECRALYKNGRKLGRVTGVYPGSMMHFKNALEQVGGNTSTSRGAPRIASGVWAMGRPRRIGMALETWHLTSQRSDSDLI